MLARGRHAGAGVAPSTVRPSLSVTSATICPMVPFQTAPVAVVYSKKTSGSDATLLALGTR